MILQDFLREVPLRDGTTGHIISSQNEATFGAQMSSETMEGFIEYLAEDGRAYAEIDYIIGSGWDDITIKLNC